MSKKFFIMAGLWASGAIAISCVIMATRWIFPCGRAGRYPHVRDAPTAMKVSTACLHICAITTIAALVLSTYRTQLTGDGDIRDAPEYVMSIVSINVEAQLSIVALWAVKFSFMSMYYPILPHVSVWMRAAWYSIFAYTVITLIFSFTLPFVWCRPLSTYWSSEGWCSVWRSPNALPVLTAANVTSDVCVIMYGLLAMGLMGPSWWQRAGVIFLGCLGIVVMGSSLARLAFMLIDCAGGENLRTGEKLQIVEMFSGIELLASIVAGCLPGCRKTLIKSRLWEKWKSSKSNKTQDTERCSNNGELNVYKLAYMDEGRCLRDL